jgi:hypothetical protein
MQFPQFGIQHVVFEQVTQALAPQQDTRSF